ncbi:MAG: OmpA family protein, partial [Candidatus Kapaibacteriota bacterium]
TPIDDSLKAEENRRVEIISDDWEILQPVEITTIERKASVDKVGYRGNVSSDTSISRVEVKVFVGSESRNLISHYEGTESKPFKIIDINNFLQRNNWSDLRIYGFLTARDVLGNGSGAKDSITNFELVSFVKPKENVEGMYQIDRFRLILFDFDKWTIEGNNKRIVNYIKSRIPENSTVTIYGSTDITGDESYNKVLSQNRADAVQKALGVKNSKSIGLGKEKQEFPNSLPEGRFYSRNVVVVVKKQIK